MAAYSSALCLLAFSSCVLANHSKASETDRSADARDRNSLLRPSWKKYNSFLHHNRVRHQSKATDKQTGYPRKNSPGSLATMSRPHVTKPVLPLWINDACLDVHHSIRKCDKRLERYSEEYSKQGDIILAGLFPVHYGEGCLDLEEMGSIQRMEAMAYAVQRVNSWKGFMKVGKSYLAVG